MAKTESSWPAEIVSPGSLEVHPTREGTIEEWRVHIGQHVSRGQVIGSLSRPPATPELMTTLAGQKEALSGMRTELTAQHTYATSRLFVWQRFQD